MSESEAARLMDEGEKRLTKFAPFTSTEEKQEKARDKFVQAATQYKAAGNFMGAGQAYKRAADMARLLKSDVDLADDSLNAGLMFRKASDPRAEELLNTVVDLYDRQGKTSQAAKVCKTIGDMGGDNAEVWYAKAIRYMRNEGSIVSSHDLVNKIAERMIETQRFDAARIEYEKMGKEYLDQHLTRGSAKKYFFMALLCTLAQLDRTNLMEGAAMVRGRFDEYRELDPQFNEYTQEFILVNALCSAIEDEDAGAYGDAMYAYEEIVPLEPMKNKLLLRGKAALRRGGAPTVSMDDGTD